MDIYVASPKGYQCSSEIVEEALEDAKVSGSNIVLTEDPVEAITDADVVYTDTWISMGQEDEKEERIKTFMPYQVNSSLFQKLKKMLFSFTVFQHIEILKLLKML